MKEKISIIVPVYNVEKYIDKCLNSLVNQTLKEIEIIVVNDGTKDNSQKIIDRYAKKYKKVKSYIKENGGLSSARNYGLEKAKGEYIAFVDSDDYVELNMYEEMYKKAKENDYDIVVCDLNYVYDSGMKAYASSNVSKDIFCKEDVQKSMIKIYPAAWNKIYKSKLFDNGVLFKEKVWFEDVEFLYRLFPFVSSIGVLKLPFVNYVQREGAITSKYDKRVWNYIDNWNGIIEFYEQNKFYERYKNEIEYSYVRYLYGTFLKSVSKSNDKLEYKKAVIAAKQNVKDKFPKYRHNRYFYSSIKGFYFLTFNSFIALIIFLKHRK